MLNFFYVGRAEILKFSWNARRPFKLGLSHIRAKVFIDPLGIICESFSTLPVHIINIKKKVERKEKERKKERNGIYSSGN